jgi:hypothetical protein
MRIVFVGNFDVPFSTESHHVWTWERLGHEVIKLQENRTNAQQIIDACRGAQLFQWTHTHGWNFPGEAMSLVEQIRAMGIPSFSYHLDRYFGIRNRENDYLQHPSFHLDYFFSTDGGNADGWKAVGVNHHYLLPGVVEYGAYLGQPNEQIDVLFTGSVGYHAEYPFRPKMAASLQSTYGNRFQVRTNVREAPLNALYASAKVIVGDHIFAGAPLYCSDRLFETVGRGGFIIYPDTPGITDLIPGLVIYRPQDAQDLVEKIDYYLDPAHEQERLWRRDSAFSWVRQHGTYTNRLQEILRMMNLD